MSTRSHRVGRERLDAPLPVRLAYAANEMLQRIPRWLGVQAAALVVAAALGAVMSHEPGALPLASLHALVVVFIALLAVGVALVDVRMVAIGRSLDDEPWSHRWGLRLLVLEIVAGLLATAIGVVGGALLPGTLALTSAGAAERLWVTRGLSVVLLALDVAFPLIEFWKRARRFRALRNAVVLLSRLETSCDEHLGHPLTADSMRLPLAVAERSDAVAPLGVSWSSPTPVDGLADAPGVELSEANATQVALWRLFREAHGQLLLLAEEGGGKSTQLYLLARELVAQAQRSLEQEQANLQGASCHDPLPPPCLPVVLDMSTWHNERALRPGVALEAWLIETAAKTYDVRRRPLKRWLKTGQLVPLLDALDVVPEGKRLLCVQDVNAFLALHPDRPLVVCCRPVAYAAVAVRPLALRQAVELSAPTPAVAERALGSPDAPRTPLVLGLARLAAVRDRALPAPRARDGEEPAEAARNHQLLDAFVRQMLHGGTEDEIRQAALGLAWLGYVLREHAKVTMHPGDLRLDWLPSEGARRQYRRLVGRVGAVLQFGVGLFFGLAVALVVAAVYGLDGGHPVENLFEAGEGGAAGQAGWLTTGQVGWLAVGVVGGLGIAAGLARPLHAARPPDFVERQGPTRRDRRQSLVVAVAVGALAALVGVLIGGLGAGLVGALAIGACVCLAVGTTLEMGGGLGSEREDRRRPNDGLLDSARAAVGTMATFVLVGLMSGGISGGLVVGVVAVPAVGMRRALEFVTHATLLGALVGAASVVALVGLDAALGNGGAAALHHVALRRALARSQVVPPTFVRFLERARSHGLLCRDGAGYTFVARSEMLRDLFAQEYARNYAAQFEAPPAPAPPAAMPAPPAAPTAPTAPTAMTRRPCALAGRLLRGRRERVAQAVAADGPPRADVP